MVREKLAHSPRKFLGIGEPPVAAGCTSVLNAISDALGDEVFTRSPVLVDHIVAALDTKKPGQVPLTANV